jgi:hypothetical protein
VRIFLRNQTIAFHANGVSYNLAVPDSTITFSSSNTTSTVTINTLANEWMVNTKAGLSGNYFMAGLPFLVPAGGLPGGINPVTWTGTFYTDTSGISVNWQWAAAVYTSFSTNLGSLGVKPIDASSGSQYNNSDHAGTPESFKTNVTGGARGGGGSNYTGSYSATASVCPMVQVPNYPPVANAGPNQTVFVGNTVQLDGSGSFDADGDPLTYHWSFASVPAGSAATLSSSTAVKPTFTADKPGSYVVQLVVNDGKVNSTPATVTISTQNSPPVANAGPNQTVTTHTTVHLDGSKSSDVDGDPLTYQWTITSKPATSAATLSSATIVNPTFVVDVKGTYTVQLIVNDGHVNSAPATVTISDVNSPPVANAGPNQTIIANHTVQLDGSGSTDVDGDPLTYRWAILSTPAGSTAALSSTTAVKPTFLADLIGDYVVQLIVNDGTVDSAASTVTITTNDIAPVANAGPAQTVPLGSVVTLDGSASTDSDGKPLTYQWSLLTKPAGSAATLATPTAVNPYFTADKAGSYVAQLIVNDGFLSSQPSTVTISTLNSKPVANPGPAQTVTAGATVHLDGSGSSDADGDPLTYRWAILSQPTGGTATLSSTTAVNPTFVAGLAGTYVVQLIVNDGKVDSDPKTTTITANPANQPPVVSAGPDQAITLPTNTVTLHGSVTDDGLPSNTLIITWSLASCTPMPGCQSAVAFGNASSAVTSASFSAAGSYVLQLKGDDTQLSSTANTTVTVNPPPNQPPVVSAGPDQTITLPTNTVTLNGTATDDGLPSGTLIIQWSLLCAPTPACQSAVQFSSPNTAVTNATFSAAGTYVLQLSASDTQLTSSSTATVTVNPKPNTPPVANAGPDQTVTTHTTVQLDGSKSTDADSDPLTFQWTIISKPTGSTATLSSSTLVNPTFVVDLKGTYKVQLIVNDGKVDSQPSVVTISTINSAPVANAGPDQTIFAGNTVQLNGSGSTDVDGDPLTYSWTILSAPAGSSAQLSDPAAIKPTFLADQIGTYIIQLIVNDGTVDSAASKVTITTDNLPPVADAGPNQTVALGALVTLDGSKSSDADGQAVTYQWSFTTTPAASAATLSAPNTVNPTFTADKPGTYVVQLIVNDGFVSSTPATVSISTSNTKPVANAGADQNVNAGATVQLDGSASSDADGDPLTYTWSILSQPAGANSVLSDPTAVKPTFVPALAGTYVIQLIVNDGKVNSDPVTVTVTAAQQNQPPVVSAGPDQTITLPANTVTLNGTASDDGLPNGTLTIQWTEISGPAPVAFSSPNTAVTNAAFSASGNYTLQLSADDGQLKTTSSVHVKVNPAPQNQPPVVNAGPAQAITLPTNTVTLNGSVTDDGLPNGTLMIQWSQISGPTSVVFSAPNQAVTQVSFNDAGVYVLRLTANDSQLSASADVTVIVYPNNGGKNAPPYVNAGPDQNIVLPANAQLNGVATDDGLPNGTLLISWNKVSGPGDVTFSSPTTAITTASFSLAGTYVLQLSASDSQLVSTSDVTIQVGELNGRRSNKGTDFWLMFMANDIFGGIALQPQFFISGNQPTTGLVTIPGLAFSQSFTVTPGQVTQVIVPPEALQYTSDFVENKGIHITAGAEVSVYGLSFYQFTTDGYLALPTPVLGTEYLIAAYTKTAYGSEFGIVAPYDATTVTVTPKVSTNGRIAGQPYSFVLNQGRTYQLDAEETLPTDLTGTLITSDKPIAVFGGNRCADIPPGLLYCNHVVEQMPPTDTWGQDFVTVPLIGRHNGDFFRMLASNDNTNLTVNGAQVSTLNRGSFYETLLTKPAVIHSDKPILVAQYETSHTFDGPNYIGGDPSMVLVPPFQQFGGNYTISTPLSFFDTHYVNIVAPTAALASVQLDGTAVSPSSFFAIGSSDFSGAQLQIAAGTHRLTASAPFGITMYGLHVDDSYSYTGGLNLSAPGPGTTIQVFPKTATQQPSTQACVIASVGDAFGNTPGGIQVSFAVTGTNPTTGSVDTDTSGQARFCYTGTLAGQDTVVASIGTTGDTATLTWSNNAGNQAPLVSAGPNQTITLPAPANLNGIALDDGLPSGNLAISWSQVSGPGSAAFSSTTTAVTSASFSAPGAYDLRLTANDGALSSSSDVTITVQTAPVNQAPVVNAGPDQTITLPTNIVTLNGTATDDGLPSSAKLAVQWSKISGPSDVTFSNPTGLNTQANFSQFGTTRAGTYVLRLTADDGQLSTSSDVTITIIDLNRAPNVYAGPAVTITLPTTTATLNGTVSDDGLPVGGTLTIQWSQVDGPAAVTFSSPNAAVTQASFPVAGLYNLRLRADDSQQSADSLTSVTVNPANQAPTVSVDPQYQIITLPANTATLTGTVNDDGLPNGTLQITWAQTFGPAAATFSTPNQAVTQVTFTAPGTYSFQISATDSQYTTTRNAQITVNPANQPPVVSAGPSLTAVLPNATVTLNGTVTDDGLPTGAQLTQTWSEVSGPAPVSFTSPTTPVTQATFTAAGTYDLRLTASDTQLTSSADVTVTIFAAPQNQPPVVSAGPGQTLTLPSGTRFLQGSVSDDGLPAGGTLTQQWTELSGPAPVTFSNPNSP